MLKYNKKTWLVLVLGVMIGWLLTVPYYIFASDGDTPPQAPQATSAGTSDETNNTQLESNDVKIQNANHAIEQVKQYCTDSKEDFEKVIDVLEEGNSTINSSDMVKINEVFTNFQTYCDKVNGVTVDSANYAEATKSAKENAVKIIQTANAIIKLVR